MLHPRSLLFGHTQQNNGHQGGTVLGRNWQKERWVGARAGPWSQRGWGRDRLSPSSVLAPLCLGQAQSSAYPQDPRGPSSQAGVIQSPPMSHKRGIHWLLCPASALSPTCQRQAPVALPPAIQPRRPLRVPRTHCRLPPGAWPLQLSEGSEQRHPHSPLPVTQ